MAQSVLTSLVQLNHQVNPTGQNKELGFFTFFWRVQILLGKLHRNVRVLKNT